MARKGVKLDGEPVGVFGSYGWSGEAPSQVLEVAVDKLRMKHADSLVLAKYKPDN